MSLRLRLVQLVLVVALVVGCSGLYNLSRPKPAQAYGIPVIEELDIQGWIQFFQWDAQEILVDQIRQIVIKEVTKKMIEKIIGGEDGGVSGGGSAFVSDYYQYLYTNNDKDTRAYVDDEFDRLFPSYIDSAIKQEIKASFDEETQIVPEDCVDVQSIDFANDPEATTKLIQASQVGCNELSAQLLLYEQALAYSDRLQNQSALELESNDGLVNKDEDTNELKQSGVVYSGVIQGALEAVYGVQINSESAVSTIIGAFVDQMLDELLSQEF